MLEIENAFLVVAEVLDEPHKVRQSSLYSTNVGDTTFFYGKDESFFDAVEEAKQAGHIKVRRIHGALNAMITF